MPPRFAFLVVFAVGWIGSATFAQEPPSDSLPPMVDTLPAVGTLTAVGPCCQPGSASCASGSCNSCATGSCATGSCEEQGLCSCWFRAESLFWWYKSAPLPVLAVDPTTGFEIGDHPAGFGVAPGVRFELGFPICERLSFEGGGFVLGTTRNTLSAGSNAAGSPALVRPFINADTGAVGGSFVSVPGVVAGTFQATSQTQLWGVDPHAYLRVVDRDGLRFGWTAGFRFLDLQETLELDDSRNLLTGGTFFNGAFKAGDRLVIVDQFHTHNRFSGGQIGAHGEAEWGPLVLTGDFRLGIGTTDETVDVTGTTAFFPGPGNAFLAPAGLQALGSNAGHHDSSGFALAPEMTLGAGYQLTSHVRLSIGYDFLYLSQVVRPGDQVPLVLSAAQIPTSPTFILPTGTIPAPVANRTDFWAQGVHAEVMIRY
jgi:Putative beta barrel porin-7 (BBP7)